MSGKVQEKEGQISDMTQKLKVGSAEHRGDTRGVPDHLGASGGTSQRSHVPCEHLPAGGDKPRRRRARCMRLAVSRKYVHYKWIPRLEHRMGEGR